MRVRPSIQIQEEIGKIPTIHNVIISDRSGSMSGSKYNSSCESIKKELEILAQDKNAKFTQTVIEFDSHGSYSVEKHVRLIEHYWLDKSNPVKFDGHGAQGGTPLYNAMGEIFARLEKEVKPEDRVLIKVFTDGEDTDATRGSRNEWNKSSIGVYINKLISVNKWTITFNCTAQDKHYILSIGIPESNILTHNNTAQDIERVSNLRTSSTLGYSKSVAGGASADSLVSSFYSKTVN